MPLRKNVEQWLERYRGILFFALIGLAIAGVVVFQVLRPESQAITLSTPTALPVPEATVTPRPLRVYISGAVQQPDVYALAPDSIVKDALLAAGGPTEEADLDRINLASPLSDGQHVYVPHLGEENLPVQLPTSPVSSGGKININTADQAQFETLPGIGPSIAQRIVEHRQAHGPFARIEDIVDVSGIGQGTFEKIQDLITTE
jgi:competence protein ComEA